MDRYLRDELEAGERDETARMREPDQSGRYPCWRKRAFMCPDAEWVIPDGYDMIPLRNSIALSPPKSQRGSVKPIIPVLGTVMHRYLEATRDVPNPYGLLFRTAEGYLQRFY